MHELNRGRRRICPACGVKYYDMMKEPVICPSCATPYHKDFGTQRHQAGATGDSRPKEKDAIAPTETKVKATQTIANDPENDIDNPDTENINDNDIVLTNDGEGNNALLTPEPEDEDLSDVADELPEKSPPDA